MSNFFGDPHALLILVIAGFLPNEVWRMLGLWLGGGIDEGSEILVWRYGAVAAGFVVFVATRRSIFAGVVCGEIVVLTGKWWLG